MKIKNLKELERVMKLCRANGIPEIVIDGVHMKFDEEKPNAQQQELNKPVESDSLFTYTDEQVATWSSDGN